MFGDFHRGQEEREATQERLEALRLLLGDDSEAATKTKRTDARRDAAGRRIDKPHALGKAAPQPSRRRDGQGYRIDKENDLRNWRKA